VPIELVIFDCDGVLVDSEPIINRVHAALLGQFGFAFTPELLLARFCGTPDAEMLATIQHEAGRLIPADYEERIAVLLDQACTTELAAIPGIHQAISALNVRYCVASSGVPERIRHSLRVVGLLDRFEPDIFSATMVARGKPEPDLFLYAAQTMGVHPSCCLVVEDSIAGVKAAVAAGMVVIGFCGGSHCPPGHAAALREAGAAATLENIAGLAECMATLAAGTR
jgi:HAD superfamily hydrolase (TIGR01509 family)